MSAPGLEKRTRLLWGAYEYLRDNDLSAVSSTSRLLHERDASYPRGRLAQEMEELAGAITGEHTHHGLPQDLILEGSQVIYWLIVTALLSGAVYEGLSLHDLLTNKEACAYSMQTCANNLRGVAAQLSEESRPSFSMLAEIARQVGCAALSSGVEVVEIVEYDLGEMKKRPYMAPYFSTAGSG